MDNIPLYLIEAFVVFGDCQNLAETAKRLSQTQPSASRQVDQFQTYFKKPLFKTVGRQKCLNEYGIDVCNYFKKNITEMHQLQKKLTSMPFYSKTQCLTLAARSEVLNAYISQLHFENVIQLKTLSGLEIREAMKYSNIDIAVLQENFVTYNYFRKKLFSTQWKLVIPKSWGENFVIAKNQHLTSMWIDSLKAKPFASYYSNIADVYPKTLKTVPFNQFNIKFIADDWRLIADQVKQQACWSIMPDSLVPKSEIISLSLTDYFKEFHFYIYFKKELAKNQEVRNILVQLSNK